MTINDKLTKVIIPIKLPNGFSVNNTSILSPISRIFTNFHPPYEKNWLVYIILLLLQVLSRDNNFLFTNTLKVAYLCK